VLVIAERLFHFSGGFGSQQMIGRLQFAFIADSKAGGRR